MESRFVQTLLLVVAFVLAFGAGAHAHAEFGSRLGKDEIKAEAAALTLPEAIALIEGVGPEQLGLMGEMMTLGLELQAVHGEDWMSVPDASQQFEALSTSIWKAITEVENRAAIAAYRISSASEPNARARTLDQLSDLGLLTLLTSPVTLFSIGEDDNRLGEEIKDSVAMQDRLELLLANTSSYADLLLDSRQREELIASGQASVDDLAELTIGNQSLYPVFKLLPQERVESLLTDIVAGHRLQHLQRPLRASITNGMITSMVDLSPEWVASQVEAGHHVWLAHLAKNAEDADMFDMSARIHDLPRSEQLPVIANSGDPVLFPLLSQIHDDIMLELDCRECSQQPTNIELQQLMQASISMGLAESESLAWELLAAVTPRQQDNLAQFALHTNLARNDPEASQFTSELLAAFPDIELLTWYLSHWPGEKVHLLAPAVEQRLEEWQRKVHSAQFEGIAKYHECDAFSMLMFAHGHGWFNGWDGLIDDLAEAGQIDQVLDSCQHTLAYLPRKTAEVSVLETMVEFFDIAGAGADQYQHMIRTLQTAKHPDSDPARLMILAHLEGSALLEEIPESHQQWLITGEYPPANRASSCSAPDDWDPAEEASGDDFVASSDAE